MATVPLCLLLVLGAPAVEATANPVSKVLQMLSDLQAKIIKEGEDAQKIYDEFAEACEDQSKDLGFAIKTLKAEVAEQTACVEQMGSDIADHEAKLEECAAELAKDEQDLKAATEIREKEAADFKAEEAELMETIDVIERAIAIIEREMSKTYSMVQLKSAGSVADALKVLVQAEALSSADASRLTALVQSSQSSDDGDEGVGAPDPEAYKSHSGDIVATLEGLLDKAKAQLDEARKTETADQNNFEVLELALKNEIVADEKCIAKNKAGLAECAAEKAACQGDLDAASKSLAMITADLADLHKDCMEKAQDFEMETKSRGEELNVLAEAKKVIKEATEGEGGAEDLTYSLSQQGSVSLLQLKSGADLANFEAVRFVRDLARKQHSSVLAQLAVRMASVMRYSARTGDDPFAKVKGLIKDLIERLLAEAEADATHKAYCDKELKETHAKKDDKTDEIAKLTALIDQKSARSAQLKDEVAALQKQLAELAAHQAEMDKIRAEEHEVYTTNRAELEEGLEGVKLALKILREYYAKEDKAHAAAEGAASGIIGLLEVIESDFTKGLAEMIATEETAAADYDKETKENEILKATMEQDVKYKTKEFTELDQAIAENTSDRDAVQAELDAVLEYLKKLEDQCIAKPETYEERVARREAELAGLREALEILSGEAVLLQRASTRRLRGPA